MSQLNLLALELNQALLFVCSLFFFSHSIGCISCVVKKCAIPLSEPLDDHRPRNGFEEVDVFGGPRGYCHRVFTNGPGDWGSIPGRVIPKTLKWYLIPPCLTLSIIRYGSKVKWSNIGNGVAIFPVLRKGSLRVTLDHSRQLYFLSGEIQFISQGFPFLAISNFSRVRFRLFIARTVHLVLFLPTVVLGLFLLSY